LTLRTLLGDPCPAVEDLREPCQRYIKTILDDIQLLNYYLNFSIRDTILSTICMIRPFWKCFPFQGHFKAPSSGEIKSSDRRFLPSITFLGSDVKETTFATRNCYPVQSSDTIRILDERLDQLIKSI